MAEKNYRSLFVSDVHMGTADCKARYLLDLLTTTKAEYIYLVGDIFDLWAMPQKISWTKEQSAVIQTLLDMAADGVNVTYIPGNHDAPLRRFCGSRIQDIDIKLFAEHITADGRRMKVTHGDEFDDLIRFNGPLKKFGDNAYSFLLRLNRVCSTVRKTMGRSYWSLSGYVKSHLGQAQSYVNQYERLVAEKAREEGYDGVICGHIHQPGLKRIQGIDYCNDGDWVEHCTCLLEDEDGNIELVHWTEQQKLLEQLQARKTDKPELELVA